MTSREYWQQREQKQREKYLQDAVLYDLEIRTIYEAMYAEVESRIEAFYTKYATDEGITIAEAKRRAAKADVDALRAKAKRYVETHDLSPQANEEMRLYNLTMDVNRLELLKSQIGMALVEGYGELEDYADGVLTGEALAEAKRMAGELGIPVMDSPDTAHAIVNASFKNATFSDRLWANQDELRNEIYNIVTRGLIAGDSTQTLTARLRKQFDVDRYAAFRLVNTEMHRVRTEVQRRSYVESGTEFYIMLSRGALACPKCKAHDYNLTGKIYRVDEMDVGENASPFHPNCYCATAPYVDEERLKDWLDFLGNGGTTEEFNELYGGGAENSLSPS